MPETLKKIRLIARLRYGIEGLYPEQEQAMQAVLAGRDTMVVLPTGYGKSLIYQVPAACLDRPTVVVSPLIALMTDQERSIRERAVPVLRVDSTLRVTERRAAFARIRQGGRLIVLTTPETLQAEEMQETLLGAGVALLTIDEAHCISEWGHDFRPTYLQLGAARKSLGSPPLLALTATATPRVRGDIAVRLGLADPVVIAAPPHRENLAFEVHPVFGVNKPMVAGRLIKRLRRPGIVYCSTTTAVDQIHRALERARIPSSRYHGKMKDDERATAQTRYMRPRRRTVMVATSAFGMGIDKPDIRYIVHYQVPGSLEQYVQEAGRAGRDGKPSRCVLLYDPEDLGIQEHLNKSGRASLHGLLQVAEALATWSEEGRGAKSTELALSAGVAARACGTLLVMLEETGLATRDSKRAYTATVPRDQLIAAARELSGRLETRRQEDERRLGAVAGYATTQECRSAFIRRYFGEAEPPVCGRCDRCRERRGEAEPEETLETEGVGDDGEEPGEERQEPESRPRRGGRRRRRRRGSGREADRRSPSTSPDGS